jgi:hypothetical protein
MKTQGLSNNSVQIWQRIELLHGRVVIRGR